MYPITHGKPSISASLCHSSEGCLSLVTLVDFQRSFRLPHQLIWQIPPRIVGKSWIWYAVFKRFLASWLTSSLAAGCRRNAGSSQRWLCPKSQWSKDTLIPVLIDTTNLHTISTSINDITYSRVIHIHIHMYHHFPTRGPRLWSSPLFSEAASRPPGTGPIVQGPSGPGPGTKWWKMMGNGWEIWWEKDGTEEECLEK